jgi:hypothetical protein
MPLLRFAALLCVAVSLFLVDAGGLPRQSSQAAEAKEPAARKGSYTAWQYQADKQRHWCRYNYINGNGQATFQYVLYYPQEGHEKVYYFQTPSGRIWGCLTRPGAAGYNAASMKWYRLDGAGKWVRRADGDCPTPPDGGRRIADQGDAPLPVAPPPEAFAKLSAADRRTAEGFHQLLAEVAIEDGQIVGLDFGGNDVTDAALSDVGKVPSLERLYLNGTQITDGGLKQLAGLSKLTHLDVSQTQVTDAGLKQLSGLAALRTLIVRGTNGISPDGVRTARKANPRLLITGP